MQELSLKSLLQRTTEPVINCCGHFLHFYTMLWRQTTLNCRGTLLDLENPIIMGVINVTPDSFYRDSRVADTNVLSRVEDMIRIGASIIDLGAMSSRPGAEEISPEEEIRRLSPVLKAIRQSFPDQVLSIDTVWSKVARFALDLGVHMVNDISAWEIDPLLLDVVVEYKVPYVLMHMQGRPAAMQDHPQYSDVMIEVLDFLIAKQGQLTNKGVLDIIVDPGFGFGKTVDQNFELLQNLHVFKILERPILVGLSRKSLIQKALQVNTVNALNGTTALHMVALQQGAQILRVHDVEEARQCVDLWKRLQQNDRSTD